MRGPATPQPDVRAALIGFAAGLRTFTPPALVVVRRRARGGAHPALIAFPVLAGIEYVWDKHPAATSRLERPALAARLVSGASTGRIVGGGVRGAFVGGAAAVLSAPIGYAARRWLGPRLGLGDRRWAIGEDALAIACAAVAAGR